MTTCSTLEPLRINAYLLRCWKVKNAHNSNSPTTPTTRMRFHLSKPPVHEETWTSFHRKYGTRKASGRPSPTKSSPSRRNVKARSAQIASFTNPHDDFRNHERRMYERQRQMPRGKTQKGENRFNLLHNLRRVFQPHSSREENSAP